VVSVSFFFRGITLNTGDDVAKNRKSSGIPVTTMFAFGRGCGNPLSSLNESPYPQVSERLEALGHFKNAGENARSHCKRFIEVIRATASGFGKGGAPVRSTKTARPSRAQNSKARPTEHTVKTFISKHSKIDVASDAFLSSFEWRALRMMALKKHGPVCQCCGASPKTGAVMNVDHIKPRRFFPELALDLDNLQILCHECNQGKGSWDSTDWRPEEGEEFERDAHQAMLEMLSM